MFGRIMMFGVALLAAAAPVAAQDRGTMEFGAFVSKTYFDNYLNMNSSWGAGGRVGIFVFPRLSAEFEGGGGRSSRSLGLLTVNQVSIAGRLTAIPVKVGRLSLLLGAGAVHTEYQFQETYGFQGLIGAKYAFSDVLALRLDGVGDWNSNPVHTTNRALQLGLSFYRSPRGLVTTNTVTRTVAAAPMMQRPDSVSAYETHRLRGLAGNYQDLRDSLGRNPRAMPAFVIRDTVVLEGINFEFDSSSFTPDSRDVLDRVAKTLVASEWMNTSWEIAGHTSSVGTHEYNMALSKRRAESVRAYLVSKGVLNSRLFAKGYGEVDPLYPNDSEGRNWRNRRVEMRRIQGTK